jgi:hypothetical protein
MSGLARVLFYGLLAAALVVVVRAVVQNVLGLRAGTARAPSSDEADLPSDTTTPAPGPVETDVERLLSRARAAAACGDYGRAIDDAYAALLRRLDGDGLIEIHPSRTNGDYVRRLRDKPQLRREVRGVVGDVEQVQFGSAPPSETAYQKVLEKVLPLVARALLPVALFLGFSAALSCKPRGGNDEYADMSPSGTEAIVETMKAAGFKIRHRVERLTALNRPLTLVLRPETVLDEPTWSYLLAWVRRGGHLLVAGVSPLPDVLSLRIVADGEGMIHPVTKQPLSPEDEARLLPNAEWAPDEAMAMPPGLHLESSDPDLPRDAFALGRGLVPVGADLQWGDGRVLVIADGRLFTNIALAVQHDADLLRASLLRLSSSPTPEGTEVEICDGWTGAGAQTPLESVQQARLTPAMVQLLILLALLFLWKGTAFARLRDPPVEGRRAFADHVRALGLTYQRARASRYVEGLYAVWALDRLRERVHRVGGQGLISLAEAIAARTGRPEGQVMGILVEAATARDEAVPSVSKQRTTESKREGDLALMRSLMSFLAATGKRPDGPTHEQKARPR